MTKKEIVESGWTEKEATEVIENPYGSLVFAVELPGEAVTSPGGEGSWGG